MMAENQGNFESQSGSAKSSVIRQIVRLIRKAGMDYAGWRYIAKRVRQACELRPAKKGRKLPKILNSDDFRKFYAEVDKADDAQHSLMLRLLFFTGVRVSELCNMLVDEDGQPDKQLLRWQGTVPPQKWMNFYTKILSRFASNPGLKLEVSFEVPLERDQAQSKIDETRSGLKELGLYDDASLK